MDHTESFCEKRQKDSVEYSLGLMQRSPHPSRVLRGIFGVLAIVIGLAIIAWIGYNEFVETFATAHGLSLVGAVWDGPGPAGTGCAVSDRAVDIMAACNRRLRYSAVWKQPLLGKVLADESYRIDGSRAGARAREGD
jgi:hypothetical protein